MTWHLDVDAVCQGERLASSARGPGGEWDAVRAISRRTRRRLIGAGWLRARGVAPDQLAELLGAYFGRDFTSCEAVDWYVRHSLLQLQADRRARWARQYQARNAPSPCARVRLPAGSPSAGGATVTDRPPTYAPAACSVCLVQLARFVVVDDHGHVHGLACQQHISGQLRYLTAGHFLLEVLPRPEGMTL